MFELNVERAMQMVLIQEQTGHVDRLGILRLMCVFASEHAAAVKAELDLINGSRCLTDANAQAKREGAIEALEGLRDAPRNYHFLSIGNQQAILWRAVAEEIERYKQQEAPHGR